MNGVLSAERVVQGVIALNVIVLIAVTFVVALVQFAPDPTIVSPPAYCLENHLGIFMPCSWSFPEKSI